jgi:hypothetical protein
LLAAAAACGISPLFPRIQMGSELVDGWWILRLKNNTKQNKTKQTQHERRI